MMLHQHHIIPRHVGGTDDPSNIELVTIEEHAERHRVLWEQHGRWQDEVAWRMLTGQITAAAATLLAIKKAQTGRKHTQEHIEKVASAIRGKTYEEICGEGKAKELRMKRSAQSKINWENPHHRERMSKMASESWRNPNLRLRMSKKPLDTKNYSSAAKTRHADPEYKEKHRQAIIASWQKRKTGDLR